VEKVDEEEEGMDDSGDGDIFYDCAIVARKWLVTMKDQRKEFDDEPKIDGQYVVLTREVRPIIFDSDFNTPTFGCELSGSVTFKYMTGPH
jgi:hypothetical protein